MRRSQRFSAAQAAKRMFGEDDTSTETSDSSDSDSTEDCEETADGDINVNESNAVQDQDGWRMVQKDEDYFDHAIDSPLNCEIAFDIPENAKEDIEFFVKLFLTEELFEMITHFTNKRAEVALAEYDTDPNGELPTRISNWHCASINEIKKLFGIILCMKLNHKPELRNYWSKNVIYKSDFFSNRSCLSRNRFEELVRFLRFSDYENLDQDDALTKIRPFLTFVEDKCKNVYVPAKNICVDESLLLFKGRLKFRRYVPSKRARYGILSYCLCESSTGYTWNILVAAGRIENERIMSTLPENIQSFTFSEKIVVALLSNLVDKGYHLFVDNFFSSVRLAQYLYEKKTLMTGTIRHFRGIPQMLKQLHVPEKSHAFCRKDEVLLVKCVDRKKSGLKTLYLVDTAQNAGTEPHRRILRGGVSQDVEKSHTVLSYNKGMGGVDSRDSSLHPYNMPRKSFKWFAKLGLHLFHILIKNSWIVFKHCGGELDFLSYQEKVIEVLVLKTGDGRRSGSAGGRPARNMVESSPNGIYHTPKRLQPRPNRPRPTKRCKVCFREGTRKETVFVCSDCPTCPGLCADPCFRKFHLQQNS